TTGTVWPALSVPERGASVCDQLGRIVFRIENETGCAPAFWSCSVKFAYPPGAMVTCVPEPEYRSDPRAATSVVRSSVWFVTCSGSSGLGGYESVTLTVPTAPGEA